MARQVEFLDWNVEDRDRPIEGVFRTQRRLLPATQLRKLAPEEGKCDTIESCDNSRTQPVVHARQYRQDEFERQRQILLLDMGQFRIGDGPVHHLVGETFLLPLLTAHVFQGVGNGLQHFVDALERDFFAGARHQINDVAMSLLGIVVPELRFTARFPAAVLELKKFTQQRYYIFSFAGAATLPGDRRNQAATDDMAAAG